MNKGLVTLDELREDTFDELRAGHSVSTKGRSLWIN